jgi:hypothetical protein
LTSTVICPPGSVNLMALLSRLVITEFRREGSPTINTASRGGSYTMV